MGYESIEVPAMRYTASWRDSGRSAVVQNFQVIDFTFERPGDAWPRCMTLEPVSNDLRAVAVGATVARRVVHSPRAMISKGLAMTSTVLSWMGVFLDEDMEGLALAVVSSAGLKRKDLASGRGTFSGQDRRGPNPLGVRHLH